MSQTIYMTDDVYRPSDAEGYPIEQSSSELAISIAGYSYDWYFTAHCTWWDNQADPKSRIYWETRLMLNGGSIPSTEPELRFVLEISTDNFATKTQYIKSALYSTNNYIIIYPRKEPSSIYKRKTHTYTSYTFWGSGTVYLSNYAILGTEYKIRCKVQRKVNGSWTDVTRSGGNPWKTFASYAPFYQSITPPQTFWANDINTFTAHIDAKYTSEFLNKTQNNGNSGISLNIVRSVYPPYPTSGIDTEYLYCAPCRKKSEQSGASGLSQYKFTAILRITDPSDPEYVIMVARRDVSGSVSYKDTDNTTDIYENVSWSLTDTDEEKNYYETYGVLLRNAINDVLLTINAMPKYGASIWCYYRYPSSVYGTKYLHPEDNGGTDSVALAIPDTSSIPTLQVTVFTSYGFLVNDTIALPIVDYAIPALPVATIHRCEADGTPNDNGAYCKIDWSVVIVKISDEHPNSKRLVINHSEGTTDYNPLTSYTQSGQLIVAADTEQTYAIDFILSDDITTVTKTMRLSTANVTMDWLYNGNAVSFGKVARTPESVEISETWKLICYKLLVSGVDFETFMKQILARMDGIEQFARNLDNTGQKQVTFYNGSELLVREWLRSNEYTVDDPTDGDYPKIPYPEKESTPTTVYSYVGWSKQDGDTANDPDALREIDSYRNIYAAFSATVRKYMVRFFEERGGNPVQTFTDIEYQHSANTGVTPSKSGYRFAGWLPSGQYINGNTDAIAQFYKETEITDSWAEIMQAVNDGTAMQKYEIGQYKTLNCGIYGNIKAQIKGFKIDHMPSTTKKAMISWEAMDCLPTNRRMNPPIEYTTENHYTDDWVYSKNTWVGYHRYQSVWNAATTHVQTLNATVVCSTSGTFIIQYYTGRSSSQGDGDNNLIIKINNSTVFSGNPGTSALKEVSRSVSANTTLNIEVTFTHGSNSKDYVYVQLKPLDIEVTTVSQSQLATPYPHEYTVGTGSYGGWAKSELRNFLNGDFYNQIDEVVRNNIKTVGKISRSTKADTSADTKFQFADNEESGDKIYIPSRQEIMGNKEGEYLGVDFSQSRKTKYANGSTTQNVSAYWTRTSESISSKITSDEGIINWVYMPSGFRNMEGNTGVYRASETTSGVCICFCT